MLSNVHIYHVFVATCMYKGSGAQIEGVAVVMFISKMQHVL